MQLFREHQGILVLGEGEEVAAAERAIEKADHSLLDRLEEAEGATVKDEGSQFLGFHLPDLEAGRGASQVFPTSRPAPYRSREPNQILP